MARTQAEIRTVSYADLRSPSTETRMEAVKNLFHGLKSSGFIILKNHPIAIDLLNQSLQRAKTLFELPVEIKLQYHNRSEGGARGYTPFGREHAKDSSFPDLKEFWHIGRDKNIWPKHVDNFAQTFIELFHGLDEVGRELLRALTGPLNVDIDYFDAMTMNGSSILRLLHYPPVPEGADPQSIRAAAHEDINLITILPAATTSGLELKDRNGVWRAIESEPMELIVDAGDMLARITNEVIPSTTHRVVNPQGPNVSRYSMPFFMHPHPEALLTCLDSCRGTGALYGDILADQFLQQRLHAIGLT